ncbi:hypothetical protein A2U01_0039061 [Trifolium medium]|uniref:Uncharacterized protein n=1 Tax=Trifolium medium TaxID=97028 RepID=A0A392Q2G4_9FABA|nr:hypothetical protein [Trifolium medium]
MDIHILSFIRHFFNSDREQGRSGGSAPTRKGLRGWVVLEGGRSSFNDRRDDVVIGMDEMDGLWFDDVGVGIDDAGAGINVGLRWFNVAGR